MPNPTATGVSVTARTRSTSLGSVSDSTARSPVTPRELTQYTKPRERSATSRMRASVEVGATRNTVSRPADAASHSSAASAGRSGMMKPSTPASRAALAVSSSPYWRIGL